MTDFFHDLIVDTCSCQNEPEVVSPLLPLLRCLLRSRFFFRFAAIFSRFAGFFFRFAAFLLRLAGSFFSFAAFFLRSGHVGRFQFFSINSDLVMIDIVTLSLPVGVWICSPALDRKKEILLHLRSCVVHAITDIHLCVLRVQIDFQRFVFDRDVGLPIFVRGTGVTCSWNSGLPGAAIGKES